MKRQSNNPKRRLVAAQDSDAKFLSEIVRVARSVGSAHHKTKPSDYEFHPPVNLRPHKSICDGNRNVPLDEAKSLFDKGIRRGMISEAKEGELPKYVWALDEYGNVYEAKISRHSQNYHGYDTNPTK